MNRTSFGGFCCSYLNESGFGHASGCSRLRPDLRLLMLHAAGAHERQRHSGDKSKRLHDLPRGENLSGYFLTLSKSQSGLDRPLEATPWSAGIPPQDCKDREQCPPQSVGCLVGDYREDDADHDADQRHEAADVVVFAAASLKNALDDAAKAYEAKTGDKIVVSYAASSALAKQIEGGATADIFFSADLDWMDYLQQKNLIDATSRKTLLANTLVLVAPRIRLCCSPSKRIFLFLTPLVPTASLPWQV
jgi:hypothetical protein